MLCHHDVPWFPLTPYGLLLKNILHDAGKLAADEAFVPNTPGHIY